MTRLIDRMERDGLVTRARSTVDRRVVHVRITRKGRRLVEELAEPVRRLHLEQAEHLGPRTLATLNRGLVALLGEG